MIKRIDSDNLNLPHNVKKYLNKYALNNWELELANNNKYEAAVVVPVLAEYENLRLLLKSLLENNQAYFEKYIFVFVTNSSEKVTTEAIEDNKKALEFVRGIMRKRKGEDEFANRIIDSGLNIALIDATSPEKRFPAKTGGVGLARKIGMDLALTLFDYESENKKFLLCLDSDCRVEKNYLEEVYREVNGRNISAGYVKFEHPIDVNPFSEAIVYYEIFLRYYVLGLKFAESPYAFYTIGSTMLADVEAYISVEGMNKRKAAEDFYFMEKLSKRWTISAISGTKVYPSPRSSWRVPFGTGRAVEKYLQRKEHPFLLHSPEIFKVLKKWLIILQRSKNVSPESLLDKAGEILPELRRFLVEQSFSEAWEKIIASSPTNEQLDKQKKFWFDGFRTLKLIHYLRDNVFPDDNGFNVLEEMFMLNGFDVKPSVNGENNFKRAVDLLNVLREKI